MISCGGSGTTSTPPPLTYTVGGSVSGLSSSGLVLQDDGGNNLTVAANATSLTFSTAIANGGAYSVMVSAEPSNPSENCEPVSQIGQLRYA
jgi:hypothetical protein